MKTDAAALISPLIEDFHQLSYIIDHLKQESFGGQHTWSHEIKQATELRDKAVELIRCESDPELTGARVKVAVIGDFNAGKSSFINSLLGEALCPVKARPTTSSITTFKYGDQEAIYLLHATEYDQDGGPTRRLIGRDEYENKVCHEGNNGQRYEFEVYYPFSGFRDIELYDTPGFGNVQNSDDERITLEKCEAADAIFLIFDINRGNLGADMRRRLEKIKQNNPGLRICAILNKSDQKSNPDVVEELHEAWCDEEIFNEVVTYSAKIELGKFQEIVTNLQEFIDRLKFSTNYWKVRHERGLIHSKPNLPTPSKEKLSITNILNKIQFDKFEIIKNNQKKQSKNHLRSCKKFIFNLIKFTKSIIESNEKCHENLRVKLISKIIFNDTDITSAIASAINNGLHCQKLSRDEKSYIFTPYYKSNFHLQLFLASIEKSHTNYLIKKSLLDFTREIPPDAFRYIKEHNMLIQNIISHPEKIFASIGIEIQNEIDNKIYEEEKNFIELKHKCHLKAERMALQITQSRINDKINCMLEEIEEYEIYTKGSTEIKQKFLLEFIKKLQEFQEKFEFRSATQIK